MTANLVLRRNRRRRLEQGHPWIYQSEVDHVTAAISPGDVVDVVNHQGVFLARAYVNPNSQIIGRVFTYSAKETIDEAFLVRRLRQAQAYRQRQLGHLQSGRLVYGEADFLPGLIVDRYQNMLSVQLLTAGMERLKPQLLKALRTVYQPTGIYLRNDVPIRRLEGLPLETGVWWGIVPKEVEITENGLKFLVDIYTGQKTGFFYDQRNNRAAIAPLMTHWLTPQGELRGAEVLDCFCHTGAFAVHALAYGAAHVTAVDISQEAIDQARRNLDLNHLLDRATLQVANAFDFLREAETAGQRFDVIILDPPAFAKSKSALPGARRGYKEINLRAMRLLEEGGFLVTASCSYALSPDLFRETLLEAAMDAHKVLREVRWSGAAADHPEILGVPESHYLKFAILEVHTR